MLGFLLLRLAEHHVLPTDTRQRTRDLCLPAVMILPLTMLISQRNIMSVVI